MIQHNPCLVAAVSKRRLPGEAEDRLHAVIQGLLTTAAAFDLTDLEFEAALSTIQDAYRMELELDRKVAN